MLAINALNLGNGAQRGKGFIALQFWDIISQRVLLIKCWQYNLRG